MFTGLIEEVGVVQAAGAPWRGRASERRLRARCSKALASGTPSA